MQYGVVLNDRYAILYFDSYRSLASLTVLGAGLTSPVDGLNEKYRAKLSGKNEVPKVNSTAKGIASFKAKKVNLTWKINITGLTNATGAQLYLGNKSVNGDPIVDLMKSGNHLRRRSDS